MALVTVFPPAQKVAVDAVLGSPVGQVFITRIPGMLALSVNDCHIRNRFAYVMQQTGKTHRQTPTQFLFLAFSRRGLGSKQTALCRLRCPVRHFQSMPEQTAGTAMMMRFRGGQQMTEGGIPSNDR